MRIRTRTIDGLEEMEYPDDSCSRTSQLIAILHHLPSLYRDLEGVRQLHLPNWYIAAGYIRNIVWDSLHGYSARTALNDVDVIYYDPEDLSEETEKNCETTLMNLLPEYNWSCKNQARMHIRNEQKPYTSVLDAMKRWPETATAVGISLGWNQNIEIIAPYGLNDLFDLVLRRTPYEGNRGYFSSRIQSKKWLDIWPRLKVVEEV